MAELLPLITKISAFFCSVQILFYLHTCFFLDYEALQKRVHSLWKNFLQGGRELNIIVKKTENGRVAVAESTFSPKI